MFVPFLLHMCLNIFYTSFNLFHVVFLPILYVSLFSLSHNFDWFCPKNVDGCKILHQVETIASYETLWNTRVFTINRFSGFLLRGQALRSWTRSQRTCWRRWYPGETEISEPILGQSHNWSSFIVQLNDIQFIIHVLSSIECLKSTSNLI